MSLPAVESAKHLVALLFAAPSALEMETAARVLKLTRDDLVDALAFLENHPPLGLRVQKSGDSLELVTDPESAPFVEEMLGLNRPVKLSRAALETLAIVAYRQPVTRGDVEAVRGVNSDSAITTLLNRGLIVEMGRRDTVGRPVLYGTTSEFLQYLGLSGIDSLPPLPPSG